MTPALLLWPTVALAALWVYHDASKHRVGAVEGAEGLLNIPAGAWAFAVLFFGVVTFPLYLINRRRLIKRALTSPALSPRRGLKLSALVLYNGIIWAILLASPSGAPACDAPQARGLALDLLIEAGQARGVRVERFDRLVEVSFDEGAGRRTCRGELHSDMGVEILEYTLEARAGGRFALKFNTAYAPSAPAR
ncbi:hypothetical protein KKF91_00455 [Myxococcota bacterium]|nr:hypothetical protein [Myxococcota bacterium]MBU1429005.1 hypothetical protein [Myxococcota bacterium]MBU1896994.1 hypothetical protein [Myxococcota bacterium]